MKQFWTIVKDYMRRQKRLFVVSLVLYLITALLAMLPAKILQLTIDVGFMRSDVQALVLCIVALLLTHAIKSLLTYLSNKGMISFGNGLLKRVKSVIYDCLMEKDLSFYSENEIGYINARVEEIDSIDTLFSSTSLSVLSAVLEFVFASIILFSINWKVLLVLCIPIPALILISVSAAKKMAKQIKESLDSNAEYAGKIQDSLRGMETVKSQGLEEYENIKINHYNSSALEKQKKQSNTLNAFTVGMGSASSIITAIVYLIGGLFFISGDLTMGSFVAISTYAGKLYSPIFSYIGTSIVVQPAIIALNRVAKFFFESSVTKEDKTQSIDSIQSIDFCDVSFSYNEDDDVIKNFSMTIKSGDKVQITGKNGSGKSTLIRLLMQLISPTKGVIYINGINAVNVSKSSVISQISYVSQRNYVFNESIRANITYGIDHPDQSKVDELISQLHLNMKRNVTLYSNTNAGIRNQCYDGRIFISLDGSVGVCKQYLLPLSIINNKSWADIIHQLAKMWKKTFTSPVCENCGLSALCISCQHLHELYLKQSTEFPRAICFTQQSGKNKHRKEEEIHA